MRSLLVLILVVAAGGLAFSGYLSYRELIAGAPAALCTPAGEPGGIFGAPVCIYGFFMYLAIVVMAGVALVRRRANG